MVEFGKTLDYAMEKVDPSDVTLPTFSSTDWHFPFFVASSRRPLAMSSTLWREREDGEGERKEGQGEGQEEWGRNDKRITTLMDVDWSHELVT